MPKLYIAMETDGADKDFAYQAPYDCRLYNCRLILVPHDATNTGSWDGNLNYGLFGKSLPKVEDLDDIQDDAVFSVLGDKREYLYVRPITEETTQYSMATDFRKGPWFLKRGEVLTGKIFSIVSKDSYMVFTADIIPDFNAPIYQVHDWAGSIDPSATEGTRLYDFTIDFDMYVHSMEVQLSIAHSDLSNAITGVVQMRIIPPMTSDDLDTSDNFAVGHGDFVTDKQLVENTSHFMRTFHNTLWHERFAIKQSPLVLKADDTEYTTDVQEQALQLNRTFNPRRILKAGTLVYLEMQIYDFGSMANEPTSPKMHAAIILKARSRVKSNKPKKIQDWYMGTGIYDMMSERIGGYGKGV